MTAVPPGGSARSSSAFARATPATESTSSRWTGPTFVIAPMPGRAIAQAIERAQEGDVVVIAGKGHEQGQELADRTIPFDDREVARETLRRLGAAA